MSKVQNDTVANCSECDAEIDIPVGTEEGEIFQCQECEAELEVAEITEDDEVTLDLAPEEDEDWGE